MKPRLYAEGTSVSVARTRDEIEKLLRRNGATAFGFMQQVESAILIFEARGRRLRFILPLPHSSKQNAQPEERRRWRCLLLNVRAKFEAVTNGIVTFDEEFLPHIIVPGTTETVADRALPSLAAAYERGANLPPLLISST